MKKLFFLLCFLAVSALRANQSDAYVFVPTSTIAPVRWNLGVTSSIVQNGRVVYNLNPAGSDNVVFSEVERAIAASFQTWEDVSGSAIAFTRGPNSSTRGTSYDNQFQIYWSESANDAEFADISGALGVTFLTFRNSGELLDTALIFNGIDSCWATDGRSDCVDIAEVATHEIGHSFGLSHSPVGVSTMFPRTGTGTLRSRTLASDDAIAAAVLYPFGDFSTRTGILRGSVRDSNTAIFGANVVASDRDGNVIATALSRSDGTYRIEGLPPGDYTVFAEPIDGSTESAFYGINDLGDFYANANLDFLTTNDQAATIRGNAETALNFTVTRGTPAFNPFLVYLAGTQGNLFNLGTAVNAGTSATIGLGGPGLPNSGTPLTISGTGITVTRTRFGTYQGTSSGQVIVLDITVAANAAPGARTLFVTNGSQRAAMTGAVEIIGSGTPTIPTLSVVSAANYTQTVASESIAAVFGTSLANVTLAGRTNPLPTELGGVRIVVRDNAGTERAAPLFFVSPLQLNYQIPPGTLTGGVTVNFFNNGVATGRGTLNLERIAPGLFTANGTGRGPVAGLLLRVRANGQSVYEQLSSYVTATAQWQTVPVDWNTTTDQLFLVLFGTGIRFRTAQTAVTATVGGRAQSVTFAGAQGSLVGVDQLNVRLNRADVVGRGEMDVVVAVENKQANAVRVNFK